MANYAILKAAIDAAIYTNISRAITGDRLNAVLKSVVDSLGNGYQYKGVATTTTDPGTPDSNVFYLASGAGTYTYFSGMVIPDGVLAFLRWNGTWTMDSISVATSITAEAIEEALGYVPADEAEFQNLVVYPSFNINNDMHLIMSSPDASALSLFDVNSAGHLIMTV